MKASDLKVRARKLVKKAIKKKLLVRKPCVVCGKAEDTEAHHETHALPLTVIWLCTYHHNINDGRGEFDDNERMRVRRLVQSMFRALLRGRTLQEVQDETREILSFHGELLSVDRRENDGAYP